MKVFSWNVNGIRSVAKKGFEEWFKNTAPEFLCLQEVRAEEDQLPDFIREPEGYYAYWNPCKKKKGYSGVGILSMIKPDTVNYGMGIDEFDDEGRMVQLVFPDWVLNSVYFPNGSNGDDRLDFKLRYYDAFLENSLMWLSQGKHVVTLGDYNTCHKEIDIARPKSNEGISGFLPIERAWIDKYIENGFVDTFRTLHPEARDVYSWWSNRFGARSRNVGWRIDYCFVDKEMMNSVSAADIYPNVMGSDHCPISVDLEMPFPPIEIK